MLQTKRGRAAALIASAFALSACADSPMDPTSASAVRLPTAVARQTSVEVCQDITFNSPHGTAVGDDYVTIFGSSLDFSGTRTDDIDPDTPADLRVLDPTSPLGPDNDLRKVGVGAGQCASCVDGMLVINDTFDGTAAAPSDNAYGGEIIITGFPSGTYIKSFVLADHEASEPNAQLWVDGVDIAGAQVDAEHELQLVGTTQERLITAAGVRFVLGNPPTQLGSEAIDNIKVCRREEILGDDGCTPGFWKNHPEAWAHTPYTTTMTVEDVFDVPDSYGLDGVTLLDVMSMGGGSSTTDVAARLLHHAVAALLNASHGLVGYPQSAASVIEQTNAALASGNKTTMNNLKTKFDTQNNAGCPINGKEPLPN